VLLVRAQSTPTLFGLAFACQRTAGCSIAHFPFESSSARSLLHGYFAHSADACSRQVSASALRARLRSALSVDVSATLAAVRVPTLYLRASHDRVVPLAASELVVRLNPNARIVQFEAPHFLLQAVPSAAAKVIGAFVREVQNAL
jgi:pimeloyl-ACP methyl ester carboxylesterase